MQVCSQQYRQESQPYTETECSSQVPRFLLNLPANCQLSPQQKTDCESRWEEDGYGGKKWVEVPSTCQQNNYDTCRDVQKQKLVQVREKNASLANCCSLFLHILALPLTLVLFQVPYTDCKNVPEQQCQKVPEQQCQQEPYTAAQQVGLRFNY